MTAAARLAARVDYHLACFAEFGQTPQPEPSWVPGAVVLIGQDHSGFLLRTGCSGGLVWVTVHRLSHPPDPLRESMNGWEIGQEETLTITGDLTLISPLGGTPFFRRAFVPEHSGLHRVRVLARGRAVHRDLISETATEEYDVTLWPVETAEPGVLIGDDGLDSK